MGIVLQSVVIKRYIPGLEMLRTFASNALITVVSRILGFVRDILIARYLGVSWQMDAFLLVFKLPNFFRRLLAEGAFSQSLIPAVIKSDSPNNLLKDMYGLLVILTGLISLPFILKPKLMLGLFAYGWGETEESFTCAVSMLPWVFTYLTAMTCCSFYTAQLSINKVFYIASQLPVLLNISLIIGVLFFNHSQNVMYMAYSVLYAGMLQVVVCALAIYYYGGVLVPRLPRWSKEVSFVLKETVLGFMAQVMSYVTSVVDLFLVSLLPIGSLSWLYYAERLAYLPIGVVSVVLANILMPKISEACSQKDLNCVKGVLIDTTHFVLALSIPMMMGGVLLSNQVVSLFFGSLNFMPQDVAATAYAFKILCCALPAMMLNKVWSVCPYAFGDARVQVSIAYKSGITGLIISVILLKPLGYLAITLGGFVSSWLCSLLLLNYLKTKVGAVVLNLSIVRRIGGVAIMMWLVMKVCPDMAYMTKWGLLLNLLIKVILGTIVYFGMFYRMQLMRVLKGGFE